MLSVPIDSATAEAIETVSGVRSRGYIEIEVGSDLLPLPDLLKEEFQ